MRAFFHQKRIWNMAVLFIVLTALYFPAEALAGPVDTIISFIGQAFLTFCAGIVWMGGTLLDMSLKYTVFEMGTNIDNSGIRATVDNLWTVVRDICNLAFIFGFIYVGIATIIDPDKASTKRFLSRIIIGAFLINFSLLFTKVVIDFSNFTALQIYKAMTNGTGSVTEGIMQSLGLVTFWNVNNIDKFPTIAEGGKGFFFFMSAGIFLLITAFVFFAGALLLIVRFGVLVLLMVASPILFAATIFPATSRFSDDLKAKLFSYSMMAPIYLLLILVSMTLINGLGLKIENTNDGFTKALITGADGSLGLIFNFALMIFFMIAALVIAKSMSGAGGQFAMSIANNVRGRVQGAIGRNTIGRASHALKERYEKEDGQISTMKGVRGSLLRGIRNTMDVTGIDKGIKAGLHAGETTKFGSADSFESNKEFDKKRDAARAAIAQSDSRTTTIEDGLKYPDDKAKRIALERAVADASGKFIEEMDQKKRLGIVGLMTQSQMDALEKSEKLTESEKRELQEARTEFIKNIYNGKSAKLPATDPGRLAEEQKIRDGISKASIDHLTAMGSTFLKQDIYAARLSNSQMDDLKKKLTKTEFEELSEARKQAMIKLASNQPLTDTSLGNDGKDKNLILNQKPGDIAKLHKDVLKEVAMELPVSAYDKIVRDGTMSKADMDEVKQAFSAQYVKAPAGSQHADDIQDWLMHSPQGKMFGN